MLQGRSALLLLLVLFSQNFNPSTCQSITGCDTEACTSSIEDPYYEDDKQQLVDDIDDVNEYMQIVADQLANNSVIVVRAITARFPSADVEHCIDICTLEPGVVDFNSDQLKDTSIVENIAPSNPDMESLRTHRVTKIENFIQNSDDIQEITP